MNTQTTPKDFFLHLGATVALYIAIGSLINLAFSIINYFNPDQLAGYFYGASIAWPISMLIVLIPILYLLEWMINRDIKSVPEKANIWIRRWRIYLTLFLAVILIAGDLIFLINTYLSGEITSRFVYKVIFTLFVAGSVGKYYFFSLYPHFKPFGVTNFDWAKTARTLNAWFGIIIAVATIVTGFVIVGSPAKQRAIRFDQQRINDLSNIQWQIINYWQSKGSLPLSLEDMNDNLSGINIPTDPETKSKYEYIKKTTTSFELCAVFGQPSQDLEGRGSFGGSYDMAVSYPSYYPGQESDTWDHQAGKTCFERKIDPDRYPVTPKPL